MRIIIFVLAIGFPLSAAAQDMTLKQAIQSAYANNPALQASRMELSAAQELYPQALSGYRPTIEAEASVYKTWIDASNFGRGEGATTKEGTISIEQPVFRSLQTTAEIDESKALIAAATAFATRQEQDILLQAVIAFMNVTRDRTLYELRRNGKELFEEELNATQEKLNAGFVTKTDVSQAQARFLRAQAQVAEAASDLRASDAALEKTTGSVAGGTMYYPKTMPGDPATLTHALDILEMKNPDIIAAKHRFEAATHRERDHVRELFPQIFAFASINKQYDPQPGLIDDSQTETIGVRAAIPLYDAGITRSRIRQAGSTKEQRLKQVDDAQNKARADLISFWNQYEGAKAETAARAAEIKAAELAAEGVREETKLGERTILDILDADQDVIDAKASLAAARRDEVVAFYSVLSVLGMIQP